MLRSRRRLAPPVFPFNRRWSTLTKSPGMHRSSRRRRALRAPRHAGSARWLHRIALGCLFPVALFAALCLLVRPLRAADVELPPAKPDDPIVVAADAAHRWQQGVYDVWWLRGGVYVNQGLSYARGREGVVWIERVNQRGAPRSVVVYLEGDVTIDYQKAEPGPGGLQQTGALTARVTDKKWLGRLSSERRPLVKVTNPLGEPASKPAIFLRGDLARDPSQASGVRRAQFAEPIEAPVAATPPPGGTRRVRFFSRSDSPCQVQLVPGSASNEQVAVISGGMNLVVDGVDPAGTIDLKTDRAVIWGDLPQILAGGSQVQPRELPLEIYLEGNVEFRQGDRVIEAQRMFYDVRRAQGVVLGAEARSKVPNYEGIVRLKADVLQQIDAQRFAAQNAAITSSRFGLPTYEFRVGSLDLVDVQTPGVDALTGQPALGPQGDPLVHHDYFATARDNVLAVEGLPIFYWPTLASDLNRPTFYLERIKFSSDSVFGTQVYLDFDLYELLGVRNRPEGTDWGLSVDYLSDRGPALGTTFKYDRGGAFDAPGHQQGLFDAWGLQDDGLDNLGRGRRALEPEEDFRGRVFWQHRQWLPDSFQLAAEVGFISDRNFLEQFFEREWDERKDQSTGLELKQYLDNMTWSLAGDVRINDFFTQTQGGRADHFWLGQPLFGDAFTWYEHSHVGYFDLQVAEPPQAPSEQAKFDLLPWEVDAEGIRASTRQEIDLPLQLGPVKAVPYALGEATHWGQVIDGDNDERLFGQVGLRASLPFWTADAAVESDYWNVHGLAHKMSLEVDASFSDANRNLADLPLYDPLDDDAIEAFRRRFKFDTFGLPAGTPVPAAFDERFYAVRHGLASWVTSPSTEVAEDLLAVRLGWRNRWQTKRGRPDDRHIVDWITLDTEATIFPDPNRDNFGEEVGLVRYDFNWYLGDRLTLVSEAGFDFFPDGPKYVSLGGYLNRPPRGSLYVGFHSLEGPISAEVLALAFSYRMSPKWVSTLSSTYDFAEAGNIGQHLAVTRVGESFLVSVGLNVDVSKGNVGASLMIEPRIFARSRFGPAGGVHIPPAGAFGLE